MSTLKEQKSQGQKIPQATRLAHTPIPERLFVALDFPTEREALTMAEALAPLGVSFKVGLQLFYAAGPAILNRLSDFGKTTFVDLKLHDIPNTVAGAVDSLVRRNVRFLNIHTQGGPEMMQAAVQATKRVASETQAPPATLIGVTLLTSLSDQTIREFLLVNELSVSEYVQHMAYQAFKAGLDGVVCSAQEATVLRESCGPDFLLITPGIRPAGSDKNDQLRVITPTQALRNGADYLVVGRPITQNANPIEAAKHILEEMHEALA